MNEFVEFIKDKFSTFVEEMFFIPSEFQIWYWSEVAVLVFILVLALGVIFLCDRWMKIYKLRFAASVLLTFLVLSLTLGLTGFLVSIPRLSVSVFDTFMVVCIGSPIFNLVLGVIASFGSRLRNNHPIPGALLLFGAGFVFGYVLFTTFILFVLRLFD
jgi:hypothetical protein